MTLELVPWRGDNVPVLSSNGNGVTRSFGIDGYLAMLEQSWRYGGNLYPTGTQGVTYTQNGKRAEPVSNNFIGYVESLLYRSGPVAAVEWKRVEVFSQAPLLFQTRKDGRPGDLYDDESLNLARAPWVGGTTSDLDARGLLYADFGGNAYVVLVEDELVVLRPDYVEIVLEPRMVGGAQVGWKQVGITYQEAGAGPVAMFMRGEYAHFAPRPDPLATYRGMSWLTPVIREIQADKAAVEHRLSFMEQAATPNLAISVPQAMTPDQFNEWVERMDAAHKGPSNAGKTLYTAGGADVTVIGANMREMDLAALLGKSETRIANAAGVHPAIVGFSEGMQGSSLNAGNYQAAKRQFVDTTMRFLWANWCGSLQVLFPPPKDGDRLWYDIRDIPFLHDDARDLAAVQQTQGAVITSYVREGFTPDSAVAAVRNDDITLLQHTGLTSVQLTPPSEGELPAEETGEEPVVEELPDEPVEDTYTEEESRAATWLFGHVDEVVRAYRYRHGWIPVAPLATLSPDTVDEEYGRELDRVEFGDTGRIVARERGVTVESDSGSDIAIHATPSALDAERWADAIQSREPFSRSSFSTEPHDGGVAVRFGSHEVDLGDDEANELAQGLRDMAYVAEDREPEDSEAYVDAFDAERAVWVWDDVDADGWMGPAGVETLARALGWSDDLTRADVPLWPEAVEWLRRNVTDRLGHVHGADGKFVRKLLGAGDGPANEEMGRQRVTTHGGSVAALRLKPRKVKVDDRVYNPNNPRQMGTVVALYADPKIRVRYPDGREETQTLFGNRRYGVGDYVTDLTNPKVKGRVEEAWTDRTMRVVWDDGRSEVRPVASVTDPIPDPDRKYEATPPEPLQRMDDEVPTRKRSVREKAADMVAAGRLSAETAERLLGGESAAKIVDSRSPQGFREAELAKLSDADRTAVEALDPDKAEVYWLRRTAGQSHTEAMAGLGEQKAAKKAPAKRAPRKKSTPPAAPKPESLSQDPAVRAVQVENRIRQAYRELQRQPGDWVPLAQLREKLPDLDRAEVDASVTALAVQPGAHVIPWDNFKVLSAADRAAAVRIGDADSHVMRLEDPSDRPLLPAAAPEPAPARRAPRTKTAAGPGVGSQVKLKASVGSFASTGIVKSVTGEGPTALYEVDTFEDDGRRRKEFLYRDQFTVPTKATTPPDVASSTSLADARTTAQLRALAKARGISIPSRYRTKEAIREYLLTQLGG